MKLIALTPLRNEAAFAAMTVRAALRWCDEVVALDHASTDGTSAILAGIAQENSGRLTILGEPDPKWAEMAHRQRLLMAARARGATHCAIVDGDEVLSGNLLGWIRPQVAALRPGQMLSIPMRNLWRSLGQYRSDPSVFGATAITTVAFALSPAMQWRNKHGYAHHHREPYGGGQILRIYPRQLAGGVMHLQFANWRRLLAKHAAYKCLERLNYPAKNVAEIEKTYSQAPDETGLSLSPCPPEWWAPYADILPYFDIEQEPWHEAAVRDLVAQHGRQTFSGLNLFGVV